MSGITLGSVEKIAGIALQIKEAVETVRQNEKECRAIERCVARVRAILSWIKETMPNHPAMSGPLEDLAESTQEALVLVTECQRRHIIRRLWGAGDMAKELRGVQEDIVHKLMVWNVVTNVQNSIMLTNIQYAGSSPRHPQPQDAEMVNIPETGASTSNARLENGVTERTKAETRSKEPSSPLSSKMAFSTPPSIIIPVDALFVGFRQFSLSELKDATNDFSNDNEIGRGRFSIVYKGVLQDEQKVAIKRFQKVSESLEISMHDEFNISVKLQHKNVVKLLGYCFAVTTPRPDRSEPCRQYAKVERKEFFLVLGFLPRRLAPIVTDDQLDWSSRFYIIQGIAKGIHYLHEQRIAHMDLKPSNILLDRDMNPVIIDFGLSRLLDHDDDEIIGQDSVAGTLGYMAPEYLAQGLVSMKCDIYTFGVVLLEILSGMCISEQPRGQGSVKWAWSSVQEGGEMGSLFAPAFQVNESQLMEIRRCMEVGLLCAQKDPRDRPTMPLVLQMLDGKSSVPNVQTQRDICEEVASVSSYVPLLQSHPAAYTGCST